MGTGKTLAALKWLEDKPGPCLVLCPKAALSVWAEDAARFQLGVRIHTLSNGTSRDKTACLYEVAQPGAVIVVNYETARLLPLQKIKWAAVVADECQRLGTHNSKQTLALTRMLAGAPYKLAMTGTLWHDSPSKLYSIMRWLYPQIPKRGHPYTRTWGRYNDYLQRFAKTYEISRGVYGVAYWRGLDQIAQDVRPFVLQIRADDVLDLPPIVERTYTVKMTGKVQRAYRDLSKERIAHVGDLTALAPHELTKLTRLAQLANNGTLVADDGQERTLDGLQARYEVFDELLSALGGAPVVVFTRWRKDVEQLAKRAKAYGVSRLTGDTDTLATWQAGGTQVLLANLAAGSEGVRLERAAHIIFWSVGYSAGQYAQAIARCRRAGQKAKTIYISHIVTQGSTDELIYRALRSKDRGRVTLDEATI
jgi:SNF2 family DNA or RNA helicase